VAVWTVKRRWRAYIPAMLFTTFATTSLTLTVVCHVAESIALKTRGVWGHTAWFWNLNNRFWPPTEGLTGNGEESLWNRTILIYQQVRTGTSIRISLAVPNSPGSQLPWCLGEHYISPLWGLLVGAMWSVWELRVYHLSADCSSATFWLVADWYNWPPDCHFGVARRSRTHQCTFLDSCLHKSG